MRKALLAATVVLLPATMTLTTLATFAADTTRKASAQLPVIEAEGHGYRGRPNLVQEVPTSLSVRFGIDQIAAPLVDLGAIDFEFYRAEDETAGSRKPLRFGILRPVALSMEMGEWINVEGGSIWRVDITADGSMNGRLSFTGLDLAAGQLITTSVPGMEGSTQGDLEGVGEFGNGTAWGLCMPGALTRLEWFVPAGSTVKALPFDGVEYCHGYRNIFPGLYEDMEGGLAGNCHNDPLCYAPWVNESNAAVKLIFGGFLCSGQLMATTALDETPYISTANHCISTTTEANSCQCLFFYRNGTCGGTITAGTSVTGCDLTGTYLTSDCTLIMIRPTLPTTVYWAGWTNVNPALNSASTSIHHPGGAEQAISFGVKNASSFNCGSPAGNWNSLSWNNGITEGGSSGSAIYRDSDHKLYGVLTCGASSCSQTAADDGYGRWDIAVNSGGFAAFLAAGADDAQEQNDTCATARAVVAGTAYTNMVVKRLDEDWYALPVSAGATLSMNMTFTHANGDVDLELYSACGGAVALSRVANTSNEVFTYPNSSASNTLYMRVFLGSDTRNNYSFTFTVSAPPPVNDECISPSVVGNGSYGFDTTSASDSTPTVAASCLDGGGVNLYNDVWFRYDPACTGLATISTCATASFDTRIVAYAGATCPTAASVVLSCNDDSLTCSPTTKSVMFLEVVDGFTYYIRVGSKLNSGGTGTLVLSCEPDAAPCLSDVDGSGSVDASDLATVLGAWGPCSGCTSDIDGSGTVDASDLATLLGAWGACP